MPSTLTFPGTVRGTTSARTKPDGGLGPFAVWTLIIAFCLTVWALGALSVVALL